MKKEKAAQPAKKERSTINLPNKAHIQLSKLTLVVRSKGVKMFKQELAAKMIAYVTKNPQLLSEILAA